MDAALISKVKEVLAARPRKHVRLSDVLAVIEHESHGSAIFRTTDLQYQQNLNAAAKITGMSSDAIRKAAVIQSGPFKGCIAKFRCEPGYYAWAKTLKNRPWTAEEKFLLSCSFGLGQKMMRWLVSGTAPGDWMSIIRQFMGSVNLQIAYCAGDLEQLIARYGDREVAFTCYNAGHDRDEDYWIAARKNYGKPVAARAAELEQKFKGETTNA